MIVEVDPRRIAEFLCDPVTCSPWEGKKVRPHMVACALTENRLRADPVGDAKLSDPRAHAERIAWLIRKGWSDPIQIDVGIPSLGFHPQWPVLDGNHRLYAAIIAGHDRICAEISGSIEHAAEVLGLDREMIEDLVAECDPE